MCSANLGQIFYTPTHHRESSVTTPTCKQRRLQHDTMVEKGLGMQNAIECVSMKLEVQYNIWSYHDIMVSSWTADPQNTRNPPRWSTLAGKEWVLGVMLHTNPYYIVDVLVDLWNCMPILLSSIPVFPSGQSAQELRKRYRPSGASPLSSSSVSLVHAGDVNLVHTMACPGFLRRQLHQLTWFEKFWDLNHDFWYFWPLRHV